jgi:putative DNA primase/helicase
MTARDELSVPEISAMLAGRIEALCRRPLPSGRRAGPEWRVGSIFGEAGDSLGVHLIGEKAGLWRDFADEDGMGGDPIDLVGRVMRLDKGGSVAWAKDWLGIDDSHSSPPNGQPAANHQPTPAEKKPEWTAIGPIPLDAGKAPAHPHLGECSARWFYKNPEGGVLMIVNRFETENGKEFRPQTFCVGREGQRSWQWQSLPAPRPLYNLDLLHRAPGATVHICEGEKAADAAMALFPGEVSTTWPCGGNGVGKADWSPMKGHRVLIWPDNDGKGRRAAQTAAGQCCEAGATEVRIVQTPEHWPEKWDLANPLPEGESADVLDRLRRDAKPFQVAKVAGSHEQASGLPAPPEPLTRPADEAVEYPLDALPELVRDAVRDYQDYGQQPLSMIACSALASCSLACQGLVDVRRDERLRSPVSLNFLVIAESGERKTTADRIMTTAARDWLKSKREELAGDKARAEAALIAWEKEKEGIENKIKSAASGKKAPGAEVDMDDFKRRLAEHFETKPARFIQPELFSNDATPEGLSPSLRGWPSQSLWSDEAATVIGSHGMSDEACLRFFALLNKLWDGDPLDRKRGTSESYTLHGRRFTGNLMTQEIVLKRLLSVGGGAGRGTGFLARSLIAWPDSTIGNRPYKTPNNSTALPRYGARIQALLNLPLPTEGDEMALTPAVLDLSGEARRVWIEYHDDVESTLGDMGAFADVRDFGSKAAENAARIAAIFHVVEHGTEEEISAAEMQSGCAVATWHLWEARRLLSSFCLPEDVEAAHGLLSWILSSGAATITPQRLAQFCPRRYRGPANRVTRQAGLALLLDTGHLVEEQDGRKTKYRVNPHLMRAA